MSASTEQEWLKNLIDRFGRADRRREFNFTAGPINAIPLSDVEIARILHSGSIAGTLVAPILIALLRFSVLLLFPLRNAGIVWRTWLRRARGAPRTSHALTVLSLGPQTANKDAYFSALLDNMGQPFNYVKIVGGRETDTRDFVFVERNLSLFTAFFLPWRAIVGPFIFLLHLLTGLHHLSGRKEKLLFLLLGLREINGGAAFNNKVICLSFFAHLKRCKPGSFLFPLEGRNWEKVIMAGAGALGIQGMGYLHCAITPRHLSLRHPERFYRADEIPSSVITPGEMAFDFFSQNPAWKNIRQGYFLRGSGKNADTKPEIQRDNVVFALTGNIAEGEHILQYMAKLQGATTLKAIARMNPNTSSFQHLRAYAQQLGLTLYAPQEHSRPVMCIYRSSSVAIDCLKEDIAPIYLQLAEIVSHNIFELDNQYRLETVAMDQNFNDKVEVLAEKYGTSPRVNGAKIANHYLDQSFSAVELSKLLSK